MLELKNVNGVTYDYDFDLKSEILSEKLVDMYQIGFAQDYGITLQDAEKMFLDYQALSTKQLLVQLQSLGYLSNEGSENRDYDLEIEMVMCILLNERVR